MSKVEKNMSAKAVVTPGYLTNHAALAFTRLADAQLRPHGLSLALLGPMMLLARLGPMLQRDLVRAAAVAQPAMVAILTKLEVAGCITRSPDLSDRRAATVSLTPKGQELAAFGSRLLMDENTRGVQGFSADETAALTDLLQRLISNFEGRLQEVHQK